MPAERSKATKGCARDVPQLVWTIPVEPTSVEPSSGPVTFSSSSCSMTFDDGPPPLVDPSDFVLFPPTNDCPSPKKPAHSKKKPDDHIPRPPNAFILFRSSFIKGQHVPTEVETNHSTLSKIIGLTWKNLPDDERLVWHTKAKVALDEHKRKFPQYAFRPNQSRHKGATEKRRVREVGPKDHKRCAKIAELLGKGKKGQELDEAIQEFDKHHVPEVVTRFETPLTARMYRRSSSVPIPDGGDKSKRRKSRSTSSQPTSPAAAAFTNPYPSLKAEVLPAESFMLTFSQTPLPSTSPSFEFDTFSFNSHSSPMSPYEMCDPLSQPSSPMGSEIMFHTSHSNPSELSINTSFLGFEDWNCPSPVSDNSMPATPSFMGSPIPDAFESYSLPRFDDAFSESLCGNFSAYQNRCETQFSASVCDPDNTSVYPDFERNSCSQVHMASQDHVFSAFMAALPQYAM